MSGQKERGGVYSSSPWALTIAQEGVAGKSVWSSLNTFSSFRYTTGDSPVSFLHVRALMLPSLR